MSCYCFAKRSGAPLTRNIASFVLTEFSSCVPIGAKTAPTRAPYGRVGPRRTRPGLDPATEGFRDGVFRTASSPRKSRLASHMDGISLRTEGGDHRSAWSSQPLRSDGGTITLGMLHEQSPCLTHLLGRSRMIVQSVGLPAVLGPDLIPEVDPRGCRKTSSSPVVQAPGSACVTWTPPRTLGIVRWGFARFS